ncbi:SH3 domain-containing protein [Treponema primitia]|uniref:SH3 domain-containing protein n=1 Tax=Treponema primitia TaxID=88058 RepID=UPI00397F1A1A
MKKNCIFISFITMFAVMACNSKESSGPNEIVLTNVSKENESTNDVSVADDQSIQVIAEMYVNSLEGLRLRKTPNGEKILLLPDKQKVNVLLKNDDGFWIIDGIQGNWYQIEVNGTIGWVFSGYLVNEPMTQTDIDEFLGLYKFTSVNILLNENIDIKYWLPTEDTNIFVGYEDETGYYFNCNYERVFSKYQIERKHKINLSNNGMPFYKNVGESGGSSTNYDFSFKDNTIILHLDRVKVDMSGFDDPNPDVAIDKKPTEYLIFDAAFTKQ